MKIRLRHLTVSITTSFTGQSNEAYINSTEFDWSTFKVASVK